ncbi:MAG: aminotransferase class III-fold pyridoxal phosphate-dependent enzyme, partial [Trueperaceae bacterium]
MQEPNGAKMQELWRRNQKFIAGGVFSLNRTIDPMRMFERARGAYIWDVDGKRYIDYHAAFAPYFLGHADPDVDQAVIAAVQHSSSLYGAGSTAAEGELAELLVSCVPTMEQVQVTNTGSEATSFAIRLARAVTGRDGIILMQGGYNGWQDDVAFNLMDPAEKQRSREAGDGLELNPITAGIPESVKSNVYVTQFNDLDAVEGLLASGKVAAIILEPILQNIGIVKPEPGYLEGLR